MMTLEPYRVSLDDGHETYFKGETVNNGATNKVLGLAVDSVAAGYERFYKPEPAAVRNFMMVPFAAEHRNIRSWIRSTPGATTWHAGSP